MTPMPFLPTRYRVALTEAGGGKSGWATLHEEGTDEGTVAVHFGPNGYIDKGPRALVGHHFGKVASHPSVSRVEHHKPGIEPKGARDHPTFTERPAGMAGDRGGDKSAQSAQKRAIHAHVGQSPASAQQARDDIGAALTQARDEAKAAPRKATAPDPDSTNGTGGKGIEDNAATEATRRDSAHRAEWAARQAEGTKAERASAALMAPHIIRTLPKEGDVSGNAKVIKAALDGARTPTAQLLALANSAHKWYKYMPAEANPDLRLQAAHKVFDLGARRGVDDDAYFQANRHLRDLARETGTMPTEADVHAYATKGIAARVAPHLQSGLSAFVKRDGFTDAQADTVTRAVAGAHSPGDQVVAALHALEKIDPGLPHKYDVRRIITTAAIAGATQGHTQENAFAHEYSEALTRAQTFKQDQRLMGDEPRFPHTDAEAALHADDNHDVSTGAEERRAHFGARRAHAGLAAMVADGRSDAPIAAEHGLGDISDPAHVERAAVVRRTANDLPSHYKALFHMLGGRVRVHNKTNTEVNPDRAGSTNKDTGLAADKVGGTWQADNAMVSVYNNTPTPYAPQLTRHELGHAVDTAHGQLLGVAHARPVKGRTGAGTVFTTDRSYHPDFLRIFKKHKANPRLRAYMRTVPHEMFADGFSAYHGTEGERNHLKDAAPDLHDFFGKMDQEVAHHVGEARDTVRHA